MIKIVIYSLIILVGMGLSSIIYHADNTINPYNMSNELFNDLRDNTTQHFQELIDENNNHSYEYYKKDNYTFTIHRLMNILWYYFIALFNIFTELIKWAFTFGFENPEYNYLWLAKWIVWITLIMLSIRLLPLLIYILAFFYFIYEFVTKKRKWIKKKSNKV